MKAGNLNERPDRQVAGLSAYELALLRMVTEGLGPSEMAEELASTGSAVQRQLSLIRLKLGATTDLQAAEVARARGWM